MSSFLQLSNMKNIGEIIGTNPSQKTLVKVINKLVAQSNEQKEEIRQIKQKLRVNAHFSRKS